MLVSKASQAHEQMLRVGEKLFLFQPPEKPGGTWKEMQAVAWAIEQNPDGQVRPSRAVKRTSMTTPTILRPFEMRNDF